MVLRDVTAAERGEEFSLPLWLVDAFVGEGCQGNPAGVCCVDDFPPVEWMQQLAFELHWSETTFVKRLGPASFHIRWFAPEDEAPMCGHATLAAAHVLFQNNAVQGDTIHLHSCAGSLSVTRQEREEGTWLAMDFPACPLIPCTEEETVDTFRQIVAPCSFRELLRDPFLVIALMDSEEEVRRCTPRLDVLARQSCRALSVTAPSSLPGVDFVSRYFAPKVGIPEDPVCGSSHCRLTPFWAGRLGKTVLTAHQASRRGGILKVAYDANSGRVSLAGQSRTVLKGTVRRPY